MFAGTRAADLTQPTVEWAVDLVDDSTLSIKRNAFSKERIVGPLLGRVAARAAPTARPPQPQGRHPLPPHPHALPPWGGGPRGRMLTSMGLQDIDSGPAAHKGLGLRAARPPRKAFHGLAVRLLQRHEAIRLGPEDAPRADPFPSLLLHLRVGRQLRRMSWPITASFAAMEGSVSVACPRRFSSMHRPLSPARGGGPLQPGPAGGC